MTAAWPVLAALLIVGAVCLIAARHENRRSARCQQNTREIQDMRIKVFTGGMR